MFHTKVAASNAPRFTWSRCKVAASNDLVVFGGISWQNRASNQVVSS